MHLHRDRIISRGIIVIVTGVVLATIAYLVNGLPNELGCIIVLLSTSISVSSVVCGRYVCGWVVVAGAFGYFITVAVDYGYEYASSSSSLSITLSSSYSFTFTASSASSSMA